MLEKYEVYYLPETQPDSEPDVFEVVSAHSEEEAEIKFDALVGNSIFVWDIRKVGAI